MLPRPESIFNIGGGGGWGEEEEEEEDYNTMAPSIAPEGLRIAIQQHHHHRHGRRGSNNVVTKATLKPSRPTTGRSRRQVKSLPELGFLRTCLFCMGELSLQKEVYMYRGDQGFCSVDCRYKQILQEERREFEVTYKRESTAPPNFRASSKIGESNRRRRISAVS